MRLLLRPRRVQGDLPVSDADGARIVRSQVPGRGAGLVVHPGSVGEADLVHPARRPVVGDPDPQRGLLGQERVISVQEVPRKPEALEAIRGEGRRVERRTAAVRTVAVLVRHGWSAGPGARLLRLVRGLPRERESVGGEARRAGRHLGECHPRQPALVVEGVLDGAAGEVGDLLEEAVLLALRVVVVGEAVTTAEIVLDPHQLAEGVVGELEGAPLLVRVLPALTVAIRELGEAPLDVKERGVVVTAEQAVAVGAEVVELEVEPLGGVVVAGGRTLPVVVVRARHGVVGALPGGLVLEEPVDVSEAVVVLDLADGQLPARVEERNRTQVGEEPGVPAGRAERSEAHGAGAVGAVESDWQGAAGDELVQGLEDGVPRGERDRDPGLVRGPDGGALNRLRQRCLDRRGDVVDRRQALADAGWRGVVAALRREEADRSGGRLQRCIRDPSAQGVRRIGVGAAGDRAGRREQERPQVGPGDEQLLDVVVGASGSGHDRGPLAALALPLLVGDRAVLLAVRKVLELVAARGARVREEEDGLHRLVQVVPDRVAAALVGEAPGVIRDLPTSHPDAPQGHRHLGGGPAPSCRRRLGHARVDLPEVLVLR